MKVLTLILCFASVALSQDFKTIDGKEYKNMTVKRVEPDGIVLTNNTSAIVKLYFAELPKEVQERLPRHLYGRSGSKSYAVPNPARQYIPDWQTSLNDVRHEKDQVKKELEQAQH